MKNNKTVIPEHLQFMDISEVSRTLNISKTTAYRLTRRRDLPFYRVGNALRVKREDLEAYLAERRTECMQAFVGGNENVWQ